MFSEDAIARFAVQFLPFVVAVVFHEYAHGFIAHRWGDDTAKEQGRLTLNPLPHVDPIGTVVLPAMMMLAQTSFMFGWAKPVPIDPTRFRKYRPGLFFVSIAGVCMNFMLAVFSAAIVCALHLWIPKDFYLQEPLIQMSMVSIYINYALGIFNLIPIPPLDGSKVIQSFLSYNATQKYESIAQYGTIILMMLAISGSLSILWPPISFMGDITLELMAMLFSSISGVSL
jgi:Zn-dependent protease